MVSFTGLVMANSYDKYDLLTQWNDYGNCVDSYMQVDHGELGHLKSLCAANLGVSIMILGLAIYSLVSHLCICTM